MHEVAVGPVHAGVIEPGHFRFQCHGETRPAPRDRARLPAPRRRARARGGAGQADASTHRDASPATRRSATRSPTARSSRRSPGCDVPAARPGAARRRARAGAHRQPRRGLRRAGGRHRLSARGRLLRPAARRLPQPDARRSAEAASGAAWFARAASGFDLDARATRTRMARLRCRPCDRGAWARLRPALGQAVGAGAVRGDRRAARSDIAEALGWWDPPPGVRVDRATSAATTRRASTGLRDAGRDAGHGRRLRPGVRALARGRSARSTSSREQLAGLPRRPGAANDSEHASRPTRIAVSLVEGWRGEICHVASPTSAAAFAATRSSTLRSTTGWGSRWRCATSRSPTSRSATRASTSPTAGTTCEETAHAEGISRTRCARATARSRSRRRAVASRPFRGRPVLDARVRSTDAARAPSAARPTRSSRSRQDGLRIDLGRCLFCAECVAACPDGRDRVRQRSPHGRAPARGPRRRGESAAPSPTALEREARRLFGRSLRLRQVSAGGCNGCEAEVNVLGNIVFDLGRFGIQFVASPRHADGLLITGPVTRNMRLAL